MLKKSIAGLIICVMLSVCATAEVYTGVTAARTTVAVLNSAETAPEEVCVVKGQTVTEGEILAQQKETKIFATQDGVISRTFAKEGDNVDGDVVELSPTSKYTVYCTVSKAKSAVENRIVHCGETVYISCTKNGTHRAVARIYSIDGEEYMVETTGGELYIGETVYVYRDTSFSQNAKIGIGTVVESETEKYTAKGKINRLCVGEGDHVERGQLLYTVVPDSGSVIMVPVSGIVTSINFGASKNDDQVLAVIVPQDEICVEISVNEDQIENVHIGDSVGLIYAADQSESVMNGTVAEIEYIAENDAYKVRIAPQQIPEQIGMSVEVHIQ